MQQIARIFIANRKQVVNKVFAMAKKVLSIRMSESLIALLDEHSNGKGINRNTFIVDLLTQAVGGAVQTKEDFLQTKLEALITKKIGEFAAAYDGKVNRI